METTISIDKPNLGLAIEFKTLILLFLSLLAITFTNAQEKNEQAKDKYMAPDGKLFWPKDQPVHLFVSTSADGSGIEKLENKSTPFYLDTEGVNYIRHQWAVDPETKETIYPKKEIKLEIYADSKPPVLELDFNSLRTYQKDGIRYYGSGLEISAVATDAMSGTNGIKYNNGKGEFLSYSQPLNISEEGNYEYSFYAYDNVGNTSEITTSTFSVDLSAPETALTIIGEQFLDIVSPRAKIELASEDIASGVKQIFYQIDSEGWKLYKGLISLSNLEEGAHTIFFKGEDYVSNEEDSQDLLIYMDRTAPELSLIFEGDQFENNGEIYLSNNSKLKIDTQKDKAGVDKIFYRINGEEKEYVDGIDLQDLAGAVNIEFYAVDKVGNSYKTLNLEAFIKESEILVDTIAPSIDFQLTGEQFVSRDTLFVNAETLVNLQSVDDASGIKEVKYSIDNGEYLQYSEPFLLLEEGFHNIKYYAVDQVNNKYEDSFQLYVDSSGPQIETILSTQPIGSIDLNDVEKKLDVHSRGVKMYLGATDGLTDTKEIYYTLNGAEYKYEGPFAIEDQGIVTCEIKAVDELNNVSKGEVIELFIK